MISQIYRRQSTIVRASNALNQFDIDFTYASSLIIDEEYIIYVRHSVNIICAVI